MRTPFGFPLTALSKFLGNIYEFSVTMAPGYDCSKLKGICFVEVGFYLQLNAAGAAPWKGDVYVDDVSLQAAP